MSETTPLLENSPTITAYSDGSATEYTPSLASSRAWIPQVRSNRTLVLCFDGTGDQFDQDNSNIVQFLAMLRKDDSSKQLVYYQAGIGTYTNPVLVTPVISQVSETLDEMFAWNLSAHVKGGYEFLMQNYAAGDKICIFGFSRGAYTARALAGMLQKVGLLPVCNHQQLPFAYTMYARDDEEGLKLSIMFKRTFSIDVKIEFLGVWDTVASVGLVPRSLPFVGTNSAIRFFRHALSLDERRAKFMPSYYIQSAENGHLTASSSRPSPVRRQTSQIKVYEDEENAKSGFTTNVLEVWFAGVHCDVGGGSVRNGERHSLARIPLRWMIRECFKANTGIIFDGNMLRDEVGMNVDFDAMSLKPMPPPRLSPRPELKTQHMRPDDDIPSFFSSLWKFVWSAVSFPFILLTSLITGGRKPSVNVEPRPRGPFLGEDVEELHDALSPIYDQLPRQWYWHVLEWIPLHVQKQKALVAQTDNVNDYIWTINKGRGRKVFRHVMDRQLKIHQSVKTRLEALDAAGKAGTYVPQIRPKLQHEPARRMTHEDWNVNESTWFKWWD